jgi:hypothetical protein
VHSTVSVKVTPAEIASLPPLPTRISACFKTLTPIPVKDLNSSEVAKLVSKLRQSEVQKSRCGRDVAEWYNGVRKNYGAPKPAPTKKALGLSFKR